jgi:hypothetical protein
MYYCFKQTQSIRFPVGKPDMITVVLVLVLVPNLPRRSASDIRLGQSEESVGYPGYENLQTCVIPQYIGLFERL